LQKNLACFVGGLYTALFLFGLGFGLLARIELLLHQDLSRSDTVLLIIVHQRLRLIGSAQESNDLCI